MCLWVRSPHLTTDQHLGCSFLRLCFPETMPVGVLVLVSLREWSPVPHDHIDHCVITISSQMITCEIDLLIQKPFRK